MTTKDMLQVLIKGQDFLQEGYTKLQERFDVLQKGQDEFKEELVILKNAMRDGFRETHVRLEKQAQQHKDQYNTNM